eukprot:m.177735 g.177735  ORF g.177735 m.177735 type:complete len:173 (+) comp53378_c0_seq4:1115-1633(+)
MDEAKTKTTRLVLVGKQVCECFSVGQRESKVPARAFDIDWRRIGLDSVACILSPFLRATPKGRLISQRLTLKRKLLQRESLETQGQNPLQARSLQAKQMRGNARQLLPAVVLLSSCAKSWNNSASTLKRLTRCNYSKNTCPRSGRLFQACLCVLAAFVVSRHGLSICHRGDT